MNKIAIVLAVIAATAYAIRYDIGYRDRSYINMTNTYTLAGDVSPTSLAAYIKSIMPPADFASNALWANWSSNALWAADSTNWLGATGMSNYVDVTSNNIVDIVNSNYVPYIDRWKGTSATNPVDIVQRHWASNLYTYVTTTNIVVTTNFGEYTTFSTSGVYTTTIGYNEVLIVGGGGGGASGGGGGGGYLFTNMVLSSSTPVTIGIGGSGKGSESLSGGIGSNSTIGSFVAYGGGGGGKVGTSVTGKGIDGASGGGGGANGGDTNLGGTGQYDQGNNGGAGGLGSPYPSGGGGGAGGVGQDNQSETQSGNGGIGITYNSVGYSGGGGGGMYSAGGNAGTATHGGGAGGNNSNNGTDGTINTGGGGGGAGQGKTGGTGGSGVVIIRSVSTPATTNLITITNNVHAYGRTVFGDTNANTLIRGHSVKVSQGPTENDDVVDKAYTTNLVPFVETDGTTRFTNVSYPLYGSTAAFGDSNLTTILRGNSVVVDYDAAIIATTGHFKNAAVGFVKEPNVLGALNMGSNSANGSMVVSNAGSVNIGINVTGGTMVAVGPGSINVGYNLGRMYASKGSANIGENYGSMISLLCGLNFGRVKAGASMTNEGYGAMNCGYVLLGSLIASGDGSRNAGQISAAGGTMLANGIGGENLGYIDTGTMTASGVGSLNRGHSAGGTMIASDDGSENTGLGYGNMVAAGIGSINRGQEGGGEAARNSGMVADGIGSINSGETEGNWAHMHATGIGSINVGYMNAASGYSGGPTPYGTIASGIGSVNLMDNSSGVAISAGAGSANRGQLNSGGMHALAQGSENSGYVKSSGAMYANQVGAMNVGYADGGTMSASGIGSINLGAQYNSVGDIGGGRFTYWDACGVGSINIGFTTGRQVSNQGIASVALVLDSDVLLTNDATVMLSKGSSYYDRSVQADRLLAKDSLYVGDFWTHSLMDRSWLSNNMDFAPGYWWPVMTNANAQAIAAGVDKDQVISRFNPDVRYVSGAKGQAWHLTNGSFMAFRYKPVYDCITNAFSINMWVNIPQKPGIDVATDILYSNVFMGQFYSAGFSPIGYSWAFGIMSDGGDLSTSQVRLVTYYTIDSDNAFGWGSEFTQTSDPFEFQTGEWNMVTLSFDRQYLGTNGSGGTSGINPPGYWQSNVYTSSFYYNGSSVGSSNTLIVNRPPLRQSKPICMGSQGLDSADSNSYHASFDEISFWSNTLSGAQVSSLYNSGNVRQIVTNEPGLVGAWNFDRVQESEMLDVLGNGRISGSLKILNMGSNSTDATTKGYVDSVAAVDQTWVSNYVHNATNGLSQEVQQWTNSALVDAQARIDAATNAVYTNIINYVDAATGTVNASITRLISSNTAMFISNNAQQTQISTLIATDLLFVAKIGPASSISGGGIWAMGSNAYATAPYAQAVGNAGDVYAPGDSRDFTDGSSGATILPPGRRKAYTRADAAFLDMTNLMAIGDSSMAFGRYGQAIGVGSLAINGYADGAYSLALSSPSINNTNIARTNEDAGEYAPRASGDYSVAIGPGAFAIGKHSVCLGVGAGDFAFASGIESFSVGGLALGIRSVAFSDGRAEGAFSVACADGITGPNADEGFAAGNGTANGDHSTALSRGLADGAFSLAVNEGSIASEYNCNAFNGTTNNDAGTTSIGDPIRDWHGATKKYVDTSKLSIVSYVDASIGKIGDFFVSFAVTSVYDISSVTNNGQVIGGAFYESGKIGQVWSNGFQTGSYISAPDTPAYDCFAVDFSVNLWVLHVTPSVWWWADCLIAQDDGDASKWIWGIEDQGGGIGKFKYHSKPSDFVVTSDPFTYDMGKWTMYSLTRSGSIYTFYTNGFPLAAISDATAVGNPTKSLTIGWGEGLPVTFNGAIDEVSIWSNVLSDAQIVALYNNGNGIQVTGTESCLVGAYNFDSRREGINVNGGGVFKGTVAGYPAISTNDFVIKQQLDSASFTPYAIPYSLTTTLSLVNGNLQYLQATNNVNYVVLPITTSNSSDILTLEIKSLTNYFEVITNNVTFQQTYVPNTNRTWTILFRSPAGETDWEALTL